MFTKNIKTFWFIYSAFLGAGFLCLLFCKKGDMVIWFNENSCSFLDRFFITITQIGLGALFVVPIIVALFVRYKYALTGAIAFIFTGVLSYLFKKILFKGLPRPTAFFSNGELSNLIQNFDYHTHNSFPSGHTMTAFAMLLFITLMVNKKWCSLLAICLAILVALSRVYLLQHFFVDVYVGSILGVISVWIAYAIVNRYLVQKYPTLQQGLKLKI